MDKNREVERIARWILENPAPEYELRCRAEIIDCQPSGELNEETARVIAEALCDIATDDCEGEGSRRRYSIVAIQPERVQIVCPISLRRRPDRIATEGIIAQLVKQNTELHGALVKKDKDSFTMLRQHAEQVTAERQALADEVTKYRAQASEIIDKLESLRTKSLERDILKEKHEKNMETQERLTDALVPLIMAGAKRFLNGKPGDKVDIDGNIIVEIAKAMSEQQLDAIKATLGEPLGSEVEAYLLQTAVNGKADVKKFQELYNRLSEEHRMAIASALNMGQQAALKELVS